MSKFQVWWRGSDLHDVEADNKKGALQQIKDFYGVKRAPKDTGVVKISAGYYDSMVKNNQAIGINAANM